MWSPDASSSYSYDIMMHYLLPLESSTFLGINQNVMLFMSRKGSRYIWLLFFFSSHQSSVWDTSGSRPIVGQGVCSSQTFGELPFNFSGGFLISGSVVHVFVFFLCEMHWLIYSVCYHVSQLVTRQFQYAANFGHVNLFLLPNNFTVGR